MSLRTTWEPKWWKEAVIYQIYPYSFKDSNDTGTGDLNGITSKLPYLRNLGVDVVWMSPVYASPMKDMGYDISDYRAIHPNMGTLEDWDRLCKTTHELGMKLVMDLVVNHTSDEHAWFKESRSSKDSPKRDWYIWHKGKNGQEPNNWGGIFGGSAWEFDENTQEYYCHVFDVSQPDLNWENPEVRNEVWNIMKFWLDRGCDGFRMDVINCISKTPGFPDAPVTDERSKFQFGLIHRFNGPKVATYLQEMCDVVLSQYPDAFTVGETPGIKYPEDAIPLVAHGKPLQMVFNFEHMSVDIQPGKKVFHHRDWKLTELKNVLGGWFSYMQAHDGWDSLYLENHDQPRIVSRWASSAPEHRTQAAKMLAIFHATGRGTLFIYQGQEIGSANSPTWTYDQLRDVEEINYYDEELRRRGKDADMSDVLAAIGRGGRDNARMLMAWDESANAGFSGAGVKTWIKACEDYKEWNVANQEGKKDSVLEFWRSLLKLRKQHKSLVYGWFELVDKDNEKVYAYTRTDDKAQYLVVCNFTAENVVWQSPVKDVGELLVGSHSYPVEPTTTMELQPYEGRLYVHVKP